VKGFTLLEIMIALAIMTGVVLTVISSFNYHLSVVSREKEETIAVLLARAKLEDPGFKELREKKGTFAPDHPEMTWQADTTPTELPGLNKVVMTVGWDGDKHTLSLVQYNAKQ
jgi:general secretion pathway protein I